MGEEAARQLGAPRTSGWMGAGKEVEVRKAEKLEQRQEQVWPLSRWDGPVELSWGLDTQTEL